MIIHDLTSVSVAPTSSPYYGKLALSNQATSWRALTTDSLSGYLLQPYDGGCRGNKNLVFPLNPDGDNARSAVFYHTSSGPTNPAAKSVEYDPSGPTITQGSASTSFGVTQWAHIIQFPDDLNRFIGFVHDDVNDGYDIYLIVFPETGTAAPTVSHPNGGVNVVSELGIIDYDWHIGTLAHVWNEDYSRFILFCYNPAATTNSAKAVLFDRDGAIISNAQANSTGTVTTAITTRCTAAAGYDEVRDKYVYCAGGSSCAPQGIVATVASDVITINAVVDASTYSRVFIEYIGQGIFAGMHLSSSVLYPNFSLVRASGISENSEATQAIRKANTSDNIYNDGDMNIPSLPYDPNSRRIILSKQGAAHIFITFGNTVSGLLIGGTANAQTPFAQLGSACCDANMPNIMWILGDNAAGSISIRVVDVSGIS